ncbi:hypothetical protein GCM10010358_13580 [Streptomyces minutiscleroticus]|uniref:histidine kinase n=1 Tax=Streptomyces minutiscleroticus TaxID=68238 RepID=A0A918KEZ1_9ACTN|nr:SpoIIE family protein phosphatase [Streptomyces minutiscleroticus]GGX60310.1 hypothetical protein GCM10010358_13580 [Streptomyces minutiscleroticus]
MSDGLGPELATAVALGGEMGTRFAEFDWSAHPLGAPSEWPAQWRDATATALTSRFPIVLWLGPELFLVYNNAYIQVLGDKHPAALGGAGERVWWDIWDPIGPMLAGVMETGEATWSDDLLLTIVSEGRPEERYFTFTYGPIIAGSGVVDGVFCVVTETTGRVLGERRLRMLTRMGGRLFRTRTAQEAVAAAVGACDGTHPDVPLLAVYLDGAEEPGVLAGVCEPVRGRLPERLTALLPGPAAQPQRPLEVDLGPWLPRPADGPGVQRGLLLGLTEAADGRRGHLLLGLNPRRPLDEQYRGFCRLLADQVSAALANAGSFELERRRADALAQLDQAKTMFLTNVSHEFRTPLTLLLGPLQDAITAEEDPKQRDRLETAQRNATRLLRLVDALLQFARTESERADPRPVRVDLGALTAQIASSFTELCRRAGIGLVLDCASAPAEVDVQMWETVVLNLLSNAVKFTFGGRIVVKVAPPRDGTIAVTVSDTGTGIAAEDLGRLFERFYRADNSRARSAEGSGIGLSLVRSLVELHGGGIEVDSVVNVGTSMHITLPAARGPASAGERPAGDTSPQENAYVTEAMGWVEDTIPSSVTRGTGRPLVLIVDDNADMRRHLAQVCAAHWDVALAVDGAEALRAMRRRRPDVVVTDVMMPAVDGLELVTAIRADSALSSVPVVMLSARAGVEAAGTGLGAGADDYLPKPFSSADLVNRVSARLTAGEREHERRRDEHDRTRRAQAMAEFGAALGSATSPPHLLDALLACPAGLGAPLAVLGVVEADSGNIRLTFAGELDAEVRERYHVVAARAPLPIARVISSGRPMVIPETRDLDADFAAVTRDTDAVTRAAVMYPLRDRTDTVTGALALSWPAPRGFAADELALVEQAVPVLGRALERIHAAERERRIATSFQEHQLDLDRRSGAAVLGAVYQPAAETMRVGGDWYLAAPLRDPRQVAVSVGDVVGHGLPAATVMGRLRAAAAAATLTDSRPAFVLDVLRHYAASVPGAECTTVAYAVVDSASHRVDYACAGHPYPLLVTEDRTARYLTDGRHLPLATGFCARPGTDGRDRLPPGALLLLYTDGLVERPGESLEVGLARLAAATTRLVHQPVDAVCARLLRTMAPPGGHRDDVALLAVRPVGTTPTSFVAAHPARQDALPALRARVRAWLGALHLGDTLTHDILLTLCEAIGNAVEHGVRADPRQRVSVEIFADEDTISATVTDPGRWDTDTAASRRAARGTGLTVIHGLSERVEIARSIRGTRVTMHHRRRPVPTAHDPS